MFQLVSRLFTQHQTNWGGNGKAREENHGKSQCLGMPWDARYPGVVVPLLGAWSTQHFTLDKHELKALVHEENW